MEHIECILMKLYGNNVLHSEDGSHTLGLGIKSSVSTPRISHFGPRVYAFVCVSVLDTWIIVDIICGKPVWTASKQAALCLTVRLLTKPLWQVHHRLCMNDFYSSRVWLSLRCSSEITSLCRSLRTNRNILRPILRLTRISVCCVTSVTTLGCHIQWKHFDHRICATTDDR